VNNNEYRINKGFRKGTKGIPKILDRYPKSTLNSFGSDKSKALGFYAVKNYLGIYNDLKLDIYMFQTT